MVIYALENRKSIYSQNYQHVDCLLNVEALNHKPLVLNEEDIIIQGYAHLNYPIKFGQTW